MINLDFILEDSYIECFVLKNTTPKYISTVRDKYIELITSFQNLAWKISQINCQFLDGRYLFPHPFLKNHEEMGRELDQFVHELIVTKEFQYIKTITYNSKTLIEEEFNKNFIKSVVYLNKLGIDINGKYKVWLSPPCIRTGHYINDNNISWAFRNDWQNYNTVYLWNEILHSYFNFTDYEHALIELIEDEKLRYQLGESAYSPFHSHETLEKFKLLIMPIWLKYLKEESKDIKSLVNVLKDNLTNPTF